MSVKNTENNYGAISKLLHWVIAFAIIALIAVGLFMGGLKPSPEKWQMYSMHKAIGISVLFLALIRIVWTILNKSLKPVDGMKRRDIIISKSVVGFLYIIMIGLPVSGWIMSSAGGHEISFFKLFIVPPLVGESKSIGGFFHEAHEILGFAAILLIALHAAAAFKHHFINKDNVLLRMLPFAGKCLLTGDECPTKKLKKNK